MMSSTQAEQKLERAIMVAIIGDHPIMYNKVGQEKANKLRKAIDTYCEHLKEQWQLEAFNKAEKAIKGEIKASEENLKYQREVTRNSRLANEWHCHIQGEQFALRAVSDLKAQLLKSNREHNA